MAQDYWQADEVTDIIQEYMKYHSELIGAKIGCVFKEKASKSDGVPIVCQISKCSLKYQPLLKEPFDFIITVGADAWSELTMKQREAWVDHILEHAYGLENEKTGEMQWKTRKPEIVGFPSIIQRHGVGWMNGLAKISTLQIPKDTSKEPTKRNKEGTENGTSSYDDLMSGL